MSVDGPQFKISSYCHAGGCVAVAVGRDDVSVRSSRQVDSPVLAFSARNWDVFLAGLRGVVAEDADLR